MTDEIVETVVTDDAGDAVAVIEETVTDDTLTVTDEGAELVEEVVSETVIETEDGDEVVDVSASEIVVDVAAESDDDSVDEEADADEE